MTSIPRTTIGGSRFMRIRHSRIHLFQNLKVQTDVRSGIHTLGEKR